MHLKKLSATALASVLAMSCTMTTAFATDTSNNWSCPIIAYGGGLDQSSIQQIRQEFDISDSDEVDEVTVDSSDVYKYLGVQYNTSSLISCVKVSKLDSGSGVKVKILTESNITQITSSQYANAAITAGVSDVEIDVAALSNATGESALSGVYKALEENGETIDTERTQVAQEELETTNEIAQNNADNSDFNSSNLDQAIVEIKQQLADLKEQQGSAATAEQVEQIVTDALSKFNLSDIISQDDIDKLIAFAQKYQNTSAIDSEEVKEQLNKLASSLSSQLGNLFNKAQSEGWFDKIKNFIVQLIESFKN